MQLHRKAKPTMKISNLSDSSTRKYGQFFRPGSTVEISDDVIQTYSIAEISVATQSMAKSLNRIANELEKGNEITIKHAHAPLEVHLVQPFKPKKLSIMNKIKRRLRKAKPKW
jgi:hypothetical protein